MFNRSFIFFFLPLLFFANNIFSHTIKGKITDKNNEGVPFVTIYLKGTTIGTSSNSKGDYQLEVNAGTYEVIYQVIGYKLHTEKTDVKADITKDIVLEDAAVQLKEVEVGPGKEDPSNEIIRKAQKKRSYYLNQVESYACDVYIKGLQRITKYPKQILGREVNLNNLIDTATGIAYLSESISKYWYEKPDKIKEVLVSSKVSGRNNAFSYNQASDMMFNFYQNLIQTGIAQRGVISPICGSSFLSYKYKFLGSFFENGVWVNKIQVTPKRRADPCFTGVIYICDSTWRLYGVDLFVTKQNQIRFVDTLKITQVFLPVNDSVWLPFTNKFSFVFSVFGFEGNGYYTGIQSNYILNPELAKKFFNGEEWHVNDNSNKRDSSYWDSIRPIPLTLEEKTDYHKKDSLHLIWDSKPYKDSVDKHENRFKFSKLWLGFTWKNSWKNYYVNMSPPVLGFLFSTVQGWNLETKFSFNHWNKDSRKEYEISLKPGYGFSSGRFYLSGESKIDYNPKKLSRLEISAGRELAQFNASNPISPFVNALNSLFDKRNYMKVYEKDFFKLGWRHELYNGFMVYGSAEFAERSPLLNHSGETWVKRDYVYFSNDPQYPSNETFSFERNRKFEVMAAVRLRIRQRYYSRPNQKLNQGSKFPEMNISLRKAIAGVAGSLPEYDLVSFSISDRLNLKRLGRSSYILRAGKFYNSKNMSFIDYKHFNGNQTYFTDFDLQKFQLLEYYTYSNADYFAEGYFNHNFAGFITNKIPLLRKLKLDEIIGARFLYTPGATSTKYAELSAGLKYLLVRGDFVYGVNNGVNRYGFRFGLLF
ncbi:MAG: carboxypeptidase-like regulatory domain-containing protein [Bacteroidia bacterium]|nr:carboxypeptidase-like regulatory domain-containing protein [Bacteroidia bacterium]